MFLPYWSSDLYVEVSSWFPSGKDYQPVSLNRFYNENLKNIASLCMDLDSEFFFMASPFIGCVGSLPRENFFKYNPENVFNLGFMFMAGFSENAEKAIALSIALEETKGLAAGITKCSFWRNEILESTVKVIAVASDDPFYDCSNYLKLLEVTLSAAKKTFKAPDLSYYAEKFGYDRFSIKLENERPYEKNISRQITNFEYNGTRDITGGSTRIDFPEFFGIAIAAARKY